MKGPEYYLVAANDTEREALRNERTARYVIFSVITMAFALSSALMLRTFWKTPQQRNAVVFVLGFMLVTGIVCFVRAIYRSRKVKRGAEFLLIYGVITGKRRAGEGDDSFIAINNQEFPVGPEVFAEARIGARIGVREWHGTREFFDYTFKPALIDDWLGRSRKL